MPLHINLLHEEQSKVTQRQRDPLKLGILGLLLIAFGFYGFYFFKSIGAGKVAAEKAEMERQLAQIAPKAAQAKLDEATANLSASTTTAIEKIINDRFYWGPLFTEIIAGTTGRDIQITSFDGAIRTGDAITLNVIGVSAGREPRAIAEDFRQSMEDRLSKAYGKVTSQFVSLENSDTPLLLNGKTYATANFTMGFQLTLKAK